MARLELPADVPEMTLDERIAALETERLVLRPYAQHRTVEPLKARIKELTVGIMALRKARRATEPPKRQEQY